MKKIGSLMVFFGFFAIVLDFVNAVPRILAWIYNWGNNVAWAIKIGLLVIGALLWLAGSRQEQAKPSKTE